MFVKMANSLKHSLNKSVYIVVGISFFTAAIFTLMVSVNNCSKDSNPGHLLRVCFFKNSSL
ncbi:MAG: hypothetical protein CL530_06235 [Aequorivita sp.]|nr:hypothetical protein [Aequorivita sp.]